MSNSSPSESKPDHPTGVDPEKDYTETVPMGHSLRWIHKSNLKLLLEDEFEDEGIRFELEGVLIGPTAESAAVERYGTSYWSAKSRIEDRAEAYRQFVFREELTHSNNNE